MANVFNVLLPEKYIGSDKVERTSYYNVGTAWPAKDGGMRVHLPTGVTLSGDFLILPRTGKEEQAAPASAPESENQIPF